MADAGPSRDPGDPYRMLGVSADASQRDIARAYRRAVQRAHPDRHPKDRHAAARFQALTDAYDLLRDPGRRTDYDRSHPAGEPPQPPSWRPAPASHWPGSPLPPGQPIWAGPVHVEPAATAPGTSQPERGAPAEFADPPVILGPRPGQIWGLW